MNAPTIVAGALVTMACCIDTASAADAWIAWRHNTMLIEEREAGAGFKQHWRRVAGFATKGECIASLPRESGRLTDTSSYHAMPTKNGVFGWIESTDGPRVLTAYQCWPASIDPNIRQ